MNRLPADWNEEDLLQVIGEEVQERTDLEYKRCDALRAVGKKTWDEVKADVSVDVSAMGNAAGGVIVYGMREDGHLPKELDGFTPADKATREWLEQVIQSNITPRPQGIVIRPVALSGPGAGRTAYVVLIPKSPAGWQASDHRFYRRRNFRNERLEYYEVQELMQRSVRPAVELTFGRAVIQQGTPEWRFELFAELGNVGSIRIADWKVEIKFPTSFLVQDQPQLGDTDLGDVTEDGMDYRHFTLRNSTREPLFPQDRFGLLGLVDTSDRRGARRGPSLRFRVTERTSIEARGDDCLAVRWVVYADDMEPRRGEVYLRDLIAAKNGVADMR